MTIYLPNFQTHLHCRTAFNVALSCRWLVVLALLSISACSNRTELADDVEKLAFKTLDGQRIALADRTGPVLVNFWSTSCSICLKEMPELAALYRDYSPRGFELIAVAMPSDRPDAVLELSRDRQLPFPVALDLQGEALDAFGDIHGTPTSFLLDRQGKLIKRYVGAIGMRGLRQQLDKLLGSA